MSHRWLLASVAALALVMTGCGSDKVTVTNSPAKSSSSSASSEASESTESREATSSEADAPRAPLDDPDACTDLTGANLDMALASTKEDAQKEADVFAKYNPPASVQEAIDHFVETEGPQLTDPDYDEYDKRITAWVKEVCP